MAGKMYSVLVVEQTSDGGHVLSSTVDKHTTENSVTECFADIDMKPSEEAFLPQETASGSNFGKGNERVNENSIIGSLLTPQKEEMEEELLYDEIEIENNPCQEEEEGIDAVEKIEIVNIKDEVNSDVEDVFVECSGRKELSDFACQTEPFLLTPPIESICPNSEDASQLEILNVPKAPIASKKRGRPKKSDRGKSQNNENRKNPKAPISGKKRKIGPKSFMVKSNTATKTVENNIFSSILSKDKSGNDNAESDKSEKEKARKSKAGFTAWDIFMELHSPKWQPFIKIKRVKIPTKRTKVSVSSIKELDIGSTTTTYVQGTSEVDKQSGQKTTGEWERLQSVPTACQRSSFRAAMERLHEDGNPNSGDGSEMETDQAEIRRKKKKTKSLSVRRGSQVSESSSVVSRSSVNTVDADYLNNNMLSMNGTPGQGKGKRKKSSNKGEEAEDPPYHSCKGCGKKFYEHKFLLKHLKKYNYHKDSKASAAELKNKNSDKKKPDRSTEKDEQRFSEPEKAKKLKFFKSLSSSGTSNRNNDDMSQSEAEALDRYSVDDSDSDDELPDIVPKSILQPMGNKPASGGSSITRSISLSSLSDSDEYTDSASDTTIQTTSRYGGTPGGGRGGKVVGTLTGRSGAGLSLRSPTVRLTPVSPDLGGNRRPFVHRKVTLREKLASERVERHQCDLCPLSFSLPQNLRRHVDEVHLELRNAVCPRCGEKFKRKDALRLHMAEVHSRVKPRYPCNRCGAVFTRETYRRRHITTVHTHARKYICGVCRKRFFQQSHLRTHMKFVHQVPLLYTCAKCFASFRSKFDLHLHRSQHRNEADEPEPDITTPVPVTKVRHICKLCSRGFRLLGELRRHEAMHRYRQTLQGSFSCDTCGKVYKHKQALVTHMRIHDTSAEVFKCDTCAITCVSKSALKTHRLIHLPVRPFECPSCPKSFRSRSILVEHMRIHTGEKPFRCDVCGERFRIHVLLRAHEIRLGHGAPSPYRCEVCDKVFTRAHSLATHRKMHTGRKAHACDQCDKSFLSKSALNAHVRTHSDDRPHSCDTCAKSYKTAEILRIHKRSHTGERPWKCADCPAAFPSRAQLNAHRVVHTGARPYVCTRCGKSYTGRSALRKHLHAHDGLKPHTCDVCGRGFAGADRLKAHKVSHTGEKPYRCPHCPKTFAAHSSLHTHKKTHTGSKEFACATCGKAFYTKACLARHQLVHTGEKPHKCECGKLYRYRESLKSHRAKHCPLTQK